MANISKCPICRSDALHEKGTNKSIYFYDCPVCGRFEYSEHELNSFNKNHLASYLFYHAFYHQKEGRYHCTLSKEKCDEYRRAETGRHGIPVHMDPEMVGVWYPKTFAERVDHVLLYISNHTRHMGQSITLSFNESLSLLFVDRREDNEMWRTRDMCGAEAQYLLDYLVSCHCIEYVFDSEGGLRLRLLPNGYGRVVLLYLGWAYKRQLYPHQ